jgi:urease accessory protein
MVITKKIGSIKDIDLNGRSIDYLELEWYETTKRILHKRTNAGKEIILKFLNQNKTLTEEDIVYEDGQSLIVIDIRPCEAIVIKPVTIYEMAYACYEVGNKHLPLFYEDGELLIPYEAPIFAMLQAADLRPLRVNRKLRHPLKTTVSPHNHIGSKSLFSRILQMTSSNE